MKISFENLPIIRYCISRPLNALLIVAICFAGIISIDQYFFKEELLSQRAEIAENSPALLENSPKYDITYIAWASMQPGMFQYADTQIDSNNSNNNDDQKKYLASLKSTSQKIVGCFQLRFGKPSISDNKFDFTHIILRNPL